MRFSEYWCIFRFCGIIFIWGFILTVLCSCTDYERMGVNPRPFNEPAQWENNPYGDVFQN